MHVERPPSKAEIVEFLAREFPQCKCRVLDVGAGVATVAHEIGPEELRPGGTVSGPVLMTVADVGLYVALLGQIGIVPLAVTTNLTINFLRKPAADKRIVGVCRARQGGQDPGGGRGSPLFRRHARCGRPCGGHLFHPKKARKLRFARQLMECLDAAG